MKIWVAIGGWHYEGNDDPIGVYSSEDRALSAIAASPLSYDTRKALPFELDAEPTE